MTRRLADSDLSKSSPSLRTKLLVLLSGSIVISLAAYSYMGTQLVIRDKKSYIYDYGLNQVSMVSEKVINNIQRASDLASLLLRARTVYGRSLTFEQTLSSLGVKSATAWTPSSSPNQANALIWKVGSDTDLLVSFIREQELQKLQFEAGKTYVRALSQSKLIIVTRMQDPAGSAVILALELDLGPNFIVDVAREFLFYVYDSTGTPIVTKQPTIGDQGATTELAPEELIELKSMITKSTFPYSVQNWKSQHGHSYIIAFRRVMHGQLLIASVINTDLAFTAARSLTQRSILLGIGILLVMTSIGILGQRRLTRLFIELSDATHVVTQGDFSVRVDLGHFSNDEVGKLARSFNIMTEKIETTLTELKKAHLELEDYSKNLERKVEERTAELKTANQLTSAMLDSLGQGFLIFDQHGTCKPTYSKACADVLEAVPSGHDIRDVLKIDSKERQVFDNWIKILFEGRIPFADLKELGPKRYEHRKGKSVFLEYYPLLSEEQNLAGVILVATDKTTELEAIRKMNQEKDHVKMLMKMIHYKNSFASFLRQSHSTLTRLQAQVDNGKLGAQAALTQLHTIKGAASMFGLSEISESIHALEEELGADTRKNIGLSKNLKHTLTLYSKLLIDNSRVLGFSDFGQPRLTVEIERDSYLQFCKRLSHAGIPQDIRRDARSFLKSSLRDQISRYDEFMRDLAVSLGKEVEPLRFSTDDISVDCVQLEDFFASLVHIFRNFVDHGLETPDERERVGKPRLGQVVISVATDSRPKDDSVMQIKIRDNGRGIDPRIIREKLKTRSPNVAHQEQGDSEILQHIFDDGFSTRDQATLISGRGVGLSALKHEVVRLGGEIRVHSVLGKFTEFQISIPNHELNS